MADLCQVAQDRHRIGAGGILRRQLAQGTFRIPAQNQIEQIQNPPSIRKTQHGADLIGCGFSSAVGNGLIQKRLRIAGRAFSGAGDETQRLFCDLSALCFCDSLQHRNHDIRFNAPQIKSLTARQNCNGDFANFCGGKDKFHMRRRLLQGLEQRVESVGRQHVDLIDDIDLVACRGGTIGHRINNFANIANAGAAGGIHLHHVDMAPLHDGRAMLAAATGVDGWAACAIGTDAIHALGNDARSGGLAGSANARHDEGLGDAVGFKGIAQGLDHSVLPNQIGKGLWAVFARQNLICSGVGHDIPRILLGCYRQRWHWSSKPRMGCWQFLPVRWEGERLDIDPSGARCGCFLPDLTRLARHLPAPTSRAPYRALKLTLQFIAGAN